MLQPRTRRSPKTWTPIGLALWGVLGCTSDRGEYGDTGATDAQGGVCEPAICGAADCGPVDDGCGVELDCGACLGPSGGTSTSSGFTTTTTSTTDTGDTPCTAVEAIFFDLGETLVTETSPLFFEDIPGATTLLAELKADGIRLGIITNTLTGWDEPYLASLLDNPALLDAFEVVLLSSQASAGSKPDPAIFAEAHSMLVDPPPIGQTAFVSEELEDIANRETDPTEGARAAGMVGVHLSAGAASALADHTHPPTDLASLAEAAWLSCD